MKTNINNKIMNNIKSIVAECYAALPTLPGYFVSFEALYENVNNVICENGMEETNREELRSAILEAWPKAKFEDAYVYANKTICAVRIVISKEVSLSSEEKTKLKNTIVDVLTTKCMSDDGWYDVVAVAPQIKESGIDYKEYGFSKFIDMLKTAFDENITIDDRGNKTKKYVRIMADGEPLSSVANDSKIRIFSSRVSKSNKENWKRQSAHDKLMSFAIFPKGGYNSAIKELADKALHENWFYGSEEDDPGNFPILRSYIEHTFERLQAQDEEHACDPTWEHKILTTDRNAVFNTGLVDRLYEPIYALFNRNLNESSDRRWCFWCFVKSNDKEHQYLTRIFGTNLPSPAHYYDCSSELVYDIRAKIGSYNWDHFIDNCARLPKDFLKDNGPRFDYDHLNKASDYKQLAELIKEDGRSMNRIKSRIMDAIEHAIKRVMWNFKTAIPIYYPGSKQISLLLPLALVDEDIIDVALVLEATPSGAYIAHTILTLEMAYNNARLITRPQSDWLASEKIPVKKRNHLAEKVA